MDENTTSEIVTKKLSFSRKGLIVLGASVGLIVAAGYVLAKKAPVENLTVEV